jgi:hypothetical protein
MAYLEQSDARLLSDLANRKEFTIFTKSESAPSKSIIPRFLLRDVVGKESGLRLHSYQQFVDNFMNPNTPNTRLFMQWSPGMGKTIGSLSIALKFINYYNKMQSTGTQTIGSVWILGFSENIFRADLVKFPEFGFITESELQLMTKLRELIHQGSAYDAERLNELRMRINRRLSNRQGNGFFKFMGYRALLNRLFLARDKDIQMTSLTENEIAKLILEGKVALNKDLMIELRNSLLICDEIHDVYNSAEKNNWGVALQTILNYDSTIRAVFLSATPFNNSPTELIDLLNLLTPRDHFPEFKKADFFTPSEQLIEAKVPELYKILSGRVSYITNNDPKYFPAKGYIGEKIPGISYLKFIRSPLSNFHYKTYQQAFKESKTLGADSQYLIDFALPDPRVAKPWDAQGIYKTGDIRSLYVAPPAQWRNKYKLSYDAKNGVLGGDILNIKSGELETISAKYAHMLRDIQKLIENKGGKIFIYHNIIHNSGVLFIGEILKANGFISESANSVDSTRCAICGKERREHSKEQLIIGGVKSNKEELALMTSSPLIKERIPANQSVNFANEKYKYEVVDIKGVMCKRFSMEDAGITISFILDPHGISPRLPGSTPLGPQTITKRPKLNDLGEVLVSQADIFPTDIVLGKEREDIDNWRAAFKKYKFIPLSKYYLYLAGPNSPIRNMSKSEMLSIIGGMLDEIPELAKRFVTHGGVGTSPVNDASTHKYMPCRYTLIHSDESRKVINKNIEAFNSVTNVWGEHLMILVGGKIMKQSINLMAVQHLMIVGRPDNISAMLQINGRTVRTNSHIMLPPERRLVNMSIYTSSLPDGKLSYEEQKYREKIDAYKIIQRLELILHEVAIDKDINYNIIFQPQSELQKKQHYELGILPYAPSKKKKFNMSELNLETFNAYHWQEEVRSIRFILKKIFIEESPVWKYADLLRAVKGAEYNRDMAQITEGNFILALDSLLIKNEEKYIEPVVQNLHNATEAASLYKKLTNPLDKYIYMLGGQRYGIVHIGEYYMMMPIDSITGEPIIDVEMPFRISPMQTEYSARVKDYLLYDAQNNFSDKKTRFIAKWENVDVRNLELTVCDYGTDFHKKFAEECIEYIYNVWTNPTLNKSPHHVFYIKMLYYYDLRKMIIWAHILPDKLFARYKAYAEPFEEDIGKKYKSKDMGERSITASKGFLNMLKSSLNRDNLEWISTGMVNDFNKRLKESLEMFDGNKKVRSTKKVPANNLPVGHMIGDIPRFFDPTLRNGEGEWRDDITYLENTTQYKENSIIIGYDERTKTGIAVKFKLRSPIQNIKQYKDSRQIEKGALCVTKSKVYLRQIAKQLEIPEAEYSKDNVEEICSKIRLRLIYYELKARSSGSNIKYFYFLHEIKPETMLDDITK